MLPVLGLRRCRLRSHHYLWIRTITTCIMLHCRMEEMVMLQYSSFAALSQWAKVLTPSTSHSNRVTEHSLRFQLFLDEMRKINSNWSVTHRQEWCLFLLEHLFHTAASMRLKERQQQRNQCTLSHLLETAKKTTPFHPFVRSLLGSSEIEILKITEEMYQGVLPVNSLTGDRSRWQSYIPSLVGTWLELVSGICQ